MFKIEKNAYAVKMAMGLLDKDYKIQLVSTENARAYFEKKAIELFGFGNITMVTGVYTHEDTGEKVKEPSLVIDFSFFYDDFEDLKILEKIDVFCNDLKIRYNQESIYCKIEDVYMDFK